VISPTAPDALALADRLLDSVGLLRRQVRRSVGRPWPADDSVTTAHGELIRVIRRQPGLSIAEAAAELGLAANTVSTLVTALTARQLVERIPDPDDRRVGRLHLSDDARQQVQQWRDRRAGLTAAAIKQLGAADRDRLAAALPVLSRIAELVQEQSR
jgi:DNA-binding MarR family transcriptional regulator